MKSYTLLLLFMFLLHKLSGQVTTPCTACDSLIGNIEYRYSLDYQRIFITVMAFVMQDGWQQRFKGHFYSSLSLTDGTVIDKQEGWNDCGGFSTCRGYDVSNLAKGTTVVLKVWGISSDNRVCKTGYHLFIPESDFEHLMVIE